MAHDVDVETHLPSRLRTLLHTLSHPLTSQHHLVSTLTALVHTLRLICTASPTSYSSSHSTSPWKKETINLVIQLQKIILERIIPDWQQVMGERERGLVVRVFVPFVEGDEGEEGDIIPDDPAAQDGASRDSQSSNNLPTLLMITSSQSIHAHLTYLTSSTSSTSSSPTSNPSTTTITPLLPLLLRITSTLSKSNPIDRVYFSLFPRTSRDPSTNPSTNSPAQSRITFETYLKPTLSLPSKLTNLLGIHHKSLDLMEVDVEWDEGEVWTRVFDGVEGVLWGLAGGEVGGGDGGAANSQPHLDLDPDLDLDLEPLIPLFTRLQTLNFFPTSTPTFTLNASASSTNLTRPSFFHSTFSRIMLHLAQPATSSSSSSTSNVAYAAVWQGLMDGLSAGTARTIGVSLFAVLTSRLGSGSGSGSSSGVKAPIPNAPIKLASSTLLNLLGPPTTSPSGPLISILLPSILSKQSTTYYPHSPHLGPEWESMGCKARVFVGYVGLGGERCVGLVLDEVMRVWGDGDEVKWGLMGRGAFLTLLIILLVSLLPPYHPIITRVTFHSPFLIAMQAYLGHSDAGIRRLGMLVGEIVSIASLPPSTSEVGEAGLSSGKKARDDQVVAELEGMLDDLETDDKAPRSASKEIPKVKRLDFGKAIWEGTGGGKEECRWLRAFYGLRDEDAEVQKGDELLGWNEVKSVTPSKEEVGMPEQVEVDSDDEHPVPTRGRSTKTKPKPKPPRPPPQVVDSDDDSLVGYSDESRSSSRSPSPTPSYLEEVANDPMLNTSTRAKIQRPVYLIQLLELLRARTEPEKLEVALRWGEELIRRKRDYGTELDENAEELVVQTLALSDPFDLEDFEKRRQGIVIALTACSPRHVAPLLIRLYFEAQYSLVQRSAILTGLSMGSRECAGLTLAIEPQRAKVDFPSKFLPPTLHAKYASTTDPGFVRANHAIMSATQAVTNEALRRGRDSTSERHPEVVRHRQLRVQGSSARGKITDVQQSSRNTLQAGLAPGAPTPKVAFKDIAAEYFILPMVNRFWTYLQEEITREQQTQKRYTVGGTGMILSALSVAQFLSTLTIMVHAALNSPLYLSVICPEALELAISVGSKLSVAPTFAPMGGPPGAKQFEADVVGTALELALVSLDGAKELDGGRALATEKSLTLMAAGEWASEILQKETRGEATTANVGGTKEGRVQKAAAGVLVLVSGIVEKMQALMA